MRLEQPVPFAQIEASTTLRQVTINYGSVDLHLEHEAKDAYLPFSTTVAFDPAWFTWSSDRYNPALATASMGLASTTYGNLPSNQYRYIQSSLENFGFKDVDITSFYHRNAEDDSDFDASYNLVAYAFGHQTIQDEKGDPCELVALVVRGTSPTIEWRSNADVVNPKDPDYRLRWHYGFRMSELECLEHFKAYLAKHQLDDARTRIWNLGHSRGAPVANLLGMDLNQMARSSQWSFSADNVYTYTIACSLTTMDADANQEAYRNIFNINHPEDFIGLVPLSCWGFRRYGNDLFLPSLATSYQLFNQAKPDADKLYQQLGGARANTVHGIAGPDTFCRDSADCVADVREMYTLPHKAGHGSWHPFSDFFYAFCTVAGVHGLEEAKVAAELIHLADGAYLHALTYFMKDEILEPLSPVAHNEQHYLARLKSIQKNRLDITGDTLPDVRRVTLYGPLDIDVVCLDDPAPTDTFDDGMVSLEGISLQPARQEGRVVSQIRQGKVNTTLWDTPNCVAMSYDGRTHKNQVWLPTQGRYLVVVKAYEPVDELRATVAAQHPSGVVYAQAARTYPGLASQAQTVLASEDLLALLPQEHLQQAYEKYQATGAFGRTASVEAQPQPGRTQGGDVVSSHNLLPGDRAHLQAFEMPGHRFKGWYRLGADGQPGTLVSRDKDLVVDVPGDLDVASLPARGCSADDGTAPEDPWVVDNSGVFQTYRGVFD